MNAGLFSFSHPPAAGCKRQQHKGNSSPAERSLIGADADRKKGKSKNEKDGGYETGWFLLCHGVIIHSIFLLWLFPGRQS